MEPFDTIAFNRWTALFPFPLFFLGCICALVFRLTSSRAPSAFASTGLITDDVFGIGFSVGSVPFFFDPESANTELLLPTLSFPLP